MSNESVTCKDVVLGLVILVCVVVAVCLVVAAVAFVVSLLV